MNTFFSKLINLGFMLTFLATFSAQSRGSDEQLEKRSSPNQINTKSLPNINNATETTNTNVLPPHFCENKSKIDIWFWPERYNEDTAQYALINPKYYIDKGYDLEEKSVFTDQSQKVSHRTDLNSDLQTDIISYGACVGGYGCSTSIYINCGNNQYTALWDLEIEAPGGIKVLNDKNTEWKKIITINEGADPFSQPPSVGFLVTYEYLDGTYRAVNKVKATKGNLNQLTGHSSN